MVEVTIGWGGQLQGAEADVIEGLIVNAVCLVRVLDQLVHRESGIVGLHHSVGHLDISSRAKIYRLCLKALWYQANNKSDARCWQQIRLGSQ